MLGRLWRWLKHLMAWHAVAPTPEYWTPYGLTPTPPVNTGLPVISGVTAVPNILTCSLGVWDNAPTSYLRQWTRDGAIIPDEIGANYTLVTADAGTSTGCTVTATNADGPVSASAVPVLIDAVAPPQPPVKLTGPIISGGGHVGEVLTVTPGTYTNSPTLTRQWQSGGSPIPLETGLTYTPVTGDAGLDVNVIETATNADGFVVTPSNSITIQAALVGQPFGLLMTLVQFA